MLLGLDALDTDKLLTLVCNILSFLLVCHYVECLTGSRSSVKSENRYRSRRTGFLDLLSTLVEHGLHTACEAT